MNAKIDRGKLSAVIPGICLVVVLAAICVARSDAKQKQAPKQAVDAQGAPIFRVDPFWPKPLPNRWSMQQVTGLYVESKNDHVWFLNRGANADGDEIGGSDNPPRIDCCVRGPEVIELDPEGNVVSSWGGPGYIPQWPTALQTIIADRQGNIWIAGPRRRTASSNSRMMESCSGILTIARRKVHRHSRRTISRPIFWRQRAVSISTKTPTRFT